MKAQEGGVREIARRPVAVDDLAELRRNAATRGDGLDYRASTAQWKAKRNARRPKASKLAETTDCVSTCKTGWPVR